MTDLAQQLCAIVADVNPALSVQPDELARPFADIGLDSLDLSYVLLQVEEQLGVKIEDDEVQTLVSLGGIVELVRAKRGA